MSNFINDETVFILDSYGLIFREYYAFFSRPLTNSKGQNVSALFGFFRNLSLIIKNYNPKYFIAAMDSRTPTFRHVQYPAYKATRAKTPEDLKAQFPWIEDMLTLLGIKVVRVDGYEADDIVATVARECDKNNRHCVILSADKDLQQLANQNIHMLKPDKNSVWAEQTPEDIEKDWGVKPELLLDLLSLTGDSADNVPGVQGIGPKTAVKLLQEYGSLENIYKNADQIKGSTGDKIRSGKDNAFLSKQLITLCQSVPVENLTDSDFAKIELNIEAFAKEMIIRELPALAKTYSEIGNIKIPPLKEVSSAKTQNNTAGSADSSAASTPAGKDNYDFIHNFAEAKKNKGNYKAISSTKELSEFIDEACKAKAVAFDTETDSLNTREANLIGFSLSFKKGTGVYIPLILTDSLFAPVLQKKEAFDCLYRLFSSDAKIVMHNAKYDLEVLASNGFDLSKAAFYSDSSKLFDTMVAAWLLESDKLGRSPYSLEYLSETKLGLKGTEFDEIVSKEMTFADVPLDQAASYSSEDSDFTLQLYELFSEWLLKAELTELFEKMEMKILPILAEMELEGIHLDSSYLNSYATELACKINSIEKDIYATVGHEFNIASPKQLSTVLFEERGLKGTKKTKTGFSTDTEVLETLRAFDPVPGMILDYRSNAKLLSTYVQTLPEQTDENGRVHTTFMQTGTATGRFSSKDPNLQNIPVRSEEGRKIRSAFTAPEGKVLISADYAQIELVVLAHLSGDKNLCQAFIDGTDVHKSTASLMFGVPMESVTAQMRRNAKTLNFGLMYGMGAFSLAKDMGISRAQASEFIASYFMNYSGVREFFDKNVAQAEQTGYIQTIMGRRRFIRGINSANKMEKEGAVRIAKNSPIQGSAADIVKQAMISVNQALKETGSRTKLLLQVHDELIFECPDNPKDISDAVALITEKMEHAVKLNVPLRVSVETGKAWGEFH